MKINAINQNLISRQTFKGYGSAPDAEAAKIPSANAQSADVFVKSMKDTKNARTKTNTGFMSDFIGKIKRLGLYNLREAGILMETPEHQRLVKEVDKKVEDMLEATGYGYGVLACL